MLAERPGGGRETVVRPGSGEREGASIHYLLDRASKRRKRGQWKNSRRRHKKEEQFGSSISTVWRLWGSRLGNHDVVTDVEGNIRIVAGKASKIKRWSPGKAASEGSS